MSKNVVNLFFDMDGLIVKFNQNASAEEISVPMYYEDAPFFVRTVKGILLAMKLAKLKEIKEDIEINFYILSAAFSSNDKDFLLNPETNDFAKHKLNSLYKNGLMANSEPDFYSMLSFCDKYSLTRDESFELGFDKGQVIFCSYGHKKREVLQHIPYTSGINVLFDDYSNNVRDWHNLKSGRIGVKWLNDINNIRKSNDYTSEFYDCMLEVDEFSTVIDGFASSPQAIATSIMSVVDYAKDRLTLSD